MLMVFAALTSLASGDRSASLLVEQSVFGIMLSVEQSGPEGNQAGVGALTSVHAHHAHDVAVAIRGEVPNRIGRGRLVRSVSSDRAVAWLPTGSERPPKFGAG